MALSDAMKRRKLPVKEVVEDTSLWRGHYKINWDETLLLEKKVSFIIISDTAEDACRLKDLFKRITGSFDNIEFVVTGANVTGINAELKNFSDEGYVFFCDDSVIEIVSSGLIDMLGYLTIKNVSVAGAKFLDRDNKIFNVGLSITNSGKVLFSYRGNAHNEHGYGAVASVTRNVSAVFPSFWGCKVIDLKKKGYLKGTRGYFYSAMRFFKEVIHAKERITCVPHLCLRVD